ncbi:MAG TPA: LegC family aminotransferase [Chitinophaga sp.]|uniref:LegC family aminotransferase n=1 Tax=Chitinophaga sp. TaxID=1869181 RepID=UPI002F92EC21
MKPDNIIGFVRKVFNQPEGFIPLHVPHFGGNEKKYLADTIDSTFVSSVGAYVTQFEKMMADITGARYVIATVNGTTALHLAMVLAGVKYNDEVITQPLTFVATANAITHAGGIPVFVDVDKDTMGLSPVALKAFLDEFATVNDQGQCINKKTGRRIAACVPMHTFGFPVKIEEIMAVCTAYHIPVIEDAAESLGSYYRNKHTGTFGMLGTFSFNGNKTVTCGGGGAIVTNDEAIAQRAKHISTTAKVPHAWEFVHDEVGYNYRMPNLNAALACAQLEQLPAFIENKRELAGLYAQFFNGSPVTCVQEMKDVKANYWLNTIVFPDHQQQQEFLQESNAQKVMTRPIWQLMNKLPMYAGCQADKMENAQWLEERVVNLPSSVRFN